MDFTNIEIVTTTIEEMVAKKMRQIKKNLERMATAEGSLRYYKKTHNHLVDQLNGIVGVKHNVKKFPRESLTDESYGRTP